VFGVITSSFRKKISKLSGLSNVKILHSSINVITTFLLVSFAWIFFRANNIKDAFYIIKKIFRINLELVHVWQTKKIAFLMLPNLKNALLPCLALVACLELAHIAAYKFRLKETFKTKPFVVRWGLYFAGLAALFFLGVYSDRQFIYFQF
jgi:alginate O-acetyltransferase complex protein AlgI